jgi:hypothetical protein
MHYLACTPKESLSVRTQTHPTPDSPYALPHTRVSTAAHSASEMAPVRD